MVGTTQGRVYKISLQNLTVYRDQSLDTVRKVLAYIVEQIGEAKECSSNPIRYIWDVPEGNVILEHVSADGMCAVNLFLTSSMIRKR